MKMMGASRASGREGTCTSSKGLLPFSPFAPKKIQLSRNRRLLTWLLPSSINCACTLSFILKEGKKVLEWCQVSVPSCCLSATGSSTCSYHQLQVYGEPGVVLGPDSLCGRIIIAGRQHDGAMLDLIEEGLQLLNVWKRRPLREEKGI